MSNNNRKQASNNKGANMRGKQGSKDSRAKRENLDNVRDSKIAKVISEVEGKKETVGQRRGKYTIPDSTTSKENDLSWYTRNPAMLAAAASVPFATIIGSGMDFATQTKYVPGVMQIRWMPTVGGYAEQNGGALIQSANSTYDFLVHANSRNYSYEAPDLLIMILGGSQVFSLLSAMIRAFGVVQNYKEPNMYKPDAILEAMGFVPDDLRNNLSEMWFDINELVNSTRQLWIPNTMPILQRWFWLNGNYWSDSNDNKAQLYIPVQTRYWMYNPVLSDQGGMLTPLTFQLTTTDANSATEFQPGYKNYIWKDWVKAARVMISALINDEDRGNMYGDILNAYGAEKIYALPEVPLGYKLEPLYSPEVLSQLENLTVATTSQPAGFAQTIQGTNRVVSLWDNNNNGSPAESAYPATQVLNFHINTQPTPGDIMIATRLKTAGLIWGPQGSFLQKTSGTTGVSWSYDVTKRAKLPVTAGTEVVVGISIYTAAGYGRFNQQTIRMNYDGADATTSITVPQLGDLSAFDWHPFVYDNRSVVSREAPSSDTENVIMGRDIYDVFGDFDNYTTVNQAMLRKIHATAIYSLLGVPQM